MSTLISPVAAVLAAVRDAGGVAHTGALRRDGHSRHHLTVALERGHLRRIRRGWVAAPEADPELM